MWICKLTPVAAVALLSSCAEPAGPRVDFVVTHTDQVEQPGTTRPELPPEPALVRGESGGVEAQGLIAVPDECDDLGAQAEPGGTLLTIRVIVRGSRRHPGGCGRPGSFALFQWQARVRPLPPGVHRVRVLYDYRGLRTHSTGEAAWREDAYLNRVVTEQSVTVK